MLSSSSLPGDVYGHVFNGGGLSIAGAAIDFLPMGIYSTVYSEPDGSYLLPTIDGGIQSIAASKAGYNTVVEEVLVDGDVMQDFILTAPTMIISPTNHEYTLNPEEYYIATTGTLNNGDGPLMWNASIEYPLTDAQGTYPKYGNSNTTIDFGDVSDTYLPMPLWIVQMPMAIGSLFLLFACIDSLLVTLSGGTPNYITHEE